MKVKSKEVKKAIKKVWPKLRHIWFFDDAYWMPSKERLEQALEQTKVEQMRFIQKISDCDNRALELYAAIHRLRAFMAIHGEIPQEEWIPWAFGRVAGKQFRGMSMLHSANICLTQEGLYMIEPQDDRIWKANPDKDDIFFVEM